MQQAVQPWWPGGRAAASFNTSQFSVWVDQIPLKSKHGTMYNSRQHYCCPAIIWKLPSEAHKEL